MSAGRLLIVAPDAGLRRSLEFLLEADGYAVASSTGMSAARELGLFDCTILDHRAITGGREDTLAFCRRSRPVVLLAGSPFAWLAEEVFRVVPTPLSGQPLLAAARDALQFGRNGPQ